MHEILFCVLPGSMVRFQISGFWKSAREEAVLKPSWWHWKCCSMFTTEKNKPQLLNWVVSKGQGGNTSDKENLRNH